MQLTVINSKKQWNDFIKENGGNLLQSYEWGKFQEDNQKKVWFLGNKENEETVCQFLLVKEKFFLNKKNFFHIPFGPIFKKNLLTEETEEILNFLIKEIEKINKEEKSVFLKIEPYFPLTFNDNFNLKPELKRIQPQKTIFLNLKKTEEEILKNFHPKTRYHIKLAERKGIEIFIFNNENSNIDFYSDIFFNILVKTVKRQKFNIYPQGYYQKISKIYTEDFKTELFLAKYHNDFVAGSLIVFFGETATYLHGASNYQYRHLRAPFLLHWIQIETAKKRGYKNYDFWGIDEKKYPKLTSFKKNFGGEIYKYPSGRDLIFNNKFYLIYKVFRKINDIFFSFKLK